jgi:hypothetical protein
MTQRFVKPVALTTPTDACGNRPKWPSFLAYAIHELSAEKSSLFRAMLGKILPEIDRCKIPQLKPGDEPV